MGRGTMSDVESLIQRSDLPRRTQPWRPLAARCTMLLLVGTVPMLTGCQRSPVNESNQGSSLAVAIPTEDRAIGGRDTECRETRLEQLVIRPLFTPRPWTDGLLRQNTLSVRVGRALPVAATDRLRRIKVLGHTGARPVAGIKRPFPGERITTCFRERSLIGCSWRTGSWRGASACGPSASGCQVRLAGSLRRACGSASSSG